MTKATDIVIASTPITEPFMNKVHEELTGDGFNIVRLSSEEQWMENSNVLQNADILFADGHLVIGQKHIDRAPRLRAIVTPTIGTEGIDEALATSRSIVVGNGHIPESYHSMAEATIMLILNGMYNLKASEENLRTNAPRPATPPGRMLQGKTIGLLGYGKIAQAIVEKLQPWGVEIKAFVRRPNITAPNVLPASLEEVLSTSDVLVVLLALNGDTKNLLDEEKLRLVKKDAVFINVSRGGIVDELALSRMVSEGHFRNVALDVFATEPLPADSPLRNIPRTTLTPHMVGHTHETISQFPVSAIQSIRNVVNGKPPMYVRNPDVLPGWIAKWGSVKTV
jgi:phosphoglycerate dehydrogenase-like enzyme